MRATCSDGCLARPVIVHCFIYHFQPHQLRNTNAPLHNDRPETAVVSLVYAAIRLLPTKILTSTFCVAVPCTVQLLLLRVGHFSDEYNVVRSLSSRVAIGSEGDIEADSDERGIWGRREWPETMYGRTTIRNLYCCRAASGTVNEDPHLLAS